MRGRGISAGDARTAGAGAPAPPPALFRARPPFPLPMVRGLNAGTGAQDRGLDAAWPSCWVSDPTGSGTLHGTHEAHHVTLTALSIAACLSGRSCAWL